jgi:hypothetical protein
MKTPGNPNQESEEIMSIPKILAVSCAVLGLSGAFAIAEQAPDEVLRANLGDQTVAKAPAATLLDAFKKAVSANPKQAHRILALILTSNREDALRIVDDLVAVAIQTLGDAQSTGLVSDIVHTAVIYEPAAAARIVGVAVGLLPDSYARSIVAAAVSALPRQMAGDANLQVIVKAAADAKQGTLDSADLLATAKQSIITLGNGKDVVALDGKETLPPIGELTEPNLPVVDAQPVEEFPRITLPPSPTPACP